MIMGPDTTATVMAVLGAQRLVQMATLAPARLQLEELFRLLDATSSFLNTFSITRCSWGHVLLICGAIAFCHIAELNVISKSLWQLAFRSLDLRSCESVPLLFATLPVED